MQKKTAGKTRRSESKAKRLQVLFPSAASSSRIVAFRYSQKFSYSSSSSSVRPSSTTNLTVSSMGTRQFSLALFFNFLD